MKPLKIFYKKSNVLINEILKKDDILKFEKKSFISKIFSSSKNYPDIYFHSGSLDEESIEMIENSRFTIANSYSMKHEMVKKCKVENSQIEVIYPTITSTYLKPKESKALLAQELGFYKKDKIILFHSKNLEKNGVLEFLDIIKSLSADNFKAIITGDNKQIYTLKFKFTKYNLDDKVFLLEDYENLDLLYSAADIYIIPTYMKGFNSNVIKAMFFKTAVFVSANSASREVVDIFSTMDSPNDRSMQFKVDAILNDKDELKKIKKDNKKLSEEFAYEVQLKRLEAIIKNLN